MKKIEAVIQPHKLEDVRQALKAIGVDGMTILEVRGHGRQRGHKEVYRGMEYDVDLLPKVKLEMVVPDNRYEEVVQTVVASARTDASATAKYSSSMSWRRSGFVMTIAAKELCNLSGGVGLA